MTDRRATTTEEQLFAMLADIEIAGETYDETCPDYKDIINGIVACRHRLLRKHGWALHVVDDDYDYISDPDIPETGHGNCLL